MQHIAPMHLQLKINYSKKYAVYYYDPLYITPLLHIEPLLNPRELMIRGVGPLQPVCKKRHS